MGCAVRLAQCPADYGLRHTQKAKDSVRYDTKVGVDRLVRVDYHGTKEIPTGTCNAILKAAGAP